MAKPKKAAAQKTVPEEKGPISPAPTAPDLGWPPSLNRLPSAAPPPAPPPAAPPQPASRPLAPLARDDVQLSPHFRASDLGGVPVEFVHDATRLCMQLLEPLHSATGGVLVVAGWKHAQDCSSRSLHPLATAVDVTCPTMTVAELFAVACKLQPVTCPWGEAVLYGDRVHLAMTGKKRREDVRPAVTAC